MQQKKGILQILFYFVGITACFVVYSLIQERLMTVGFGPEEEVFEYSVFIVLINRLVTCAVAASALAWLGQPLAPAAPIALFAVPSVANVVSSSAQYEALKYVSFPLQALAKCAKSVPVMAWSWVTRTRRYTSSDYASAATVTLGCALFVLAGDIAAPAAATAQAAADSAISITTVGVVLLTVFMVFDGLTSTSQDKLFASYDMHSCNQLLYTAAWSALLSSGFLIATAQLGPAVAFVARHPTSLWLMLGQSAVSTTVQLFIVFTIKQYGALNFALMMTVRQFLSIVLSCLVFQHNLSAVQWIGTLFVIGGLAHRSVDKLGGKHQGQLPQNSKQVKIAMDAATDAEREGLLSDDMGGAKIPLVVIPSPKPLQHGSSPKKSPAPAASSHLDDGAVHPGIPGITKPRPALPPLGNVFSTPLRASASTLARAFPGSGDYKQKPG